MLCYISIGVHFLQTEVGDGDDAKIGGIKNQRGSEMERENIQKETSMAISNLQSWGRFGNETAVEERGRKTKKWRTQAENANDVRKSKSTTYVIWETVSGE